MTASSPVTWDQPVSKWTDPSYLWFCAPAFLRLPGPIEIFRPTDPAFHVSMRLFGIPTGHPCRLEATLVARNDPLAQGVTGWQVSPIQWSHLGILQVRLESHGPEMGVLSVDAGGTMARLVPYLGFDGVADVAWYIVPRPNYDGFNIVHVRTGRRLESDGRLRPHLDDWDAHHWDFMRFDPGETQHRTHYHRPPGFTAPFAQHARPPTMRGRMRPVAAIGEVTSPGASLPPVKTAEDAASCLRRCEADGECRFAAVSSSGDFTCVLHRGADARLPDDVPKLSQAVDYNGKTVHTAPTYVERERNVFGDVRNRVTTGEYDRRFDRIGPSTTVFFERMSDPPPGGPAARYRSCLERHGLDSPVCAEALRELGGTEPERYTVQQGALAGPAGLCTSGATGTDSSALRSETCTAFCSDQRTRANRLCEGALRAHCAGQTNTRTYEPRCGCWLSRDSYDTIRRPRRPCPPDQRPRGRAQRAGRLLVRRLSGVDRPSHRDV